MGEKTPDSDESGIERRNVLKGLGFGAMGTVSASAFAGNVAAQDNGGDQDGSGPDGRGSRMEPSPTEMIDYAHLVEPGADADSPVGEFSDAPDGGMDLVFQLDSPGTSKSDSHTIAYQVAFVRDNNRAATKSVAEGRTRGFAGMVQTNPGGETQHREEFSTSGLQAGGEDTTYFAVLQVADYSELTDSLAVDSHVIEFTVTSG